MVPHCNLMAHLCDLITLVLKSTEHKFHTSMSQRTRVREMAQLVKCLPQGIAQYASNPAARGSLASWPRWIRKLQTQKRPCLRKSPAGLYIMKGRKDAREYTENPLGMALWPPHVQTHYVQTHEACRHTMCRHETCGHTSIKTSRPQKQNNMRAPQGLRTKGCCRSRGDKIRGV